ncbi:MAG: shikimate kinase [Blastocatellia bacterium]|nr:shikimate kinase [Blastocatellia bacterium]MBL8195942.1 shikimate kinase [Blastocatellia bacterium]MBN8724287.1 shikimate kinase [Acidobacteriota bacterium]
MGVGKTSVGSVLAQKLSYKFVDLDKLIVEQENFSIKDIFSKFGEEYFREIEHKTLETIINYTDSIIALGGGTFTFERNRNLIQQNGISIWLDCDLDVILSRLSNDTLRPLYSNPKQMQELLNSRLSAYSQANFTVDVSNLTIDETVNNIISVIRK